MNNFLRQTKLFYKRNGATILSCIGGAGVVVTAVMAVKATPKALKCIEEAKEEKGEELTKLEAVIVAGPIYIPSMLAGAGTLACIFGANVMNKRQQATLMSAYTLLETSYRDYRNKVEELYGEDVEELIQGELAKDEYEECNVVTDNSKELFYDAYSKRFFESTIEDVLRAENAINKQIAVNSGAYLNEFYEFLDIPPITAGQELGWSQGILEAMYWTCWLDFEHSKTTMEDGKECYVITMMQEPVIDFAYY